MYPYGYRFDIAYKQRNIYLDIYLKILKKKNGDSLTSRVLPGRSAAGLEAASWRPSLRRKPNDYWITWFQTSQSEIIRDKFIKRNVYYFFFSEKIIQSEVE